MLYSAGMGADYVRLERERREFTAGIPSVPDGARLLPLIFRHKGNSDNTRSLLHVWGYYVTEKHTSAPLLFAHSHSFPVIYSKPPPVRFNHLVLEGFAANATDPATLCVRLSRATSSRTTATRRFARCGGSSGPRRRRSTITCSSGTARRKRER